MRRHFIAPLVVITLAAPTSAVAQRATAPCLSATAECTEFVTVGGGPGRSLIYRNFPLNKRNDAVTSAVVVIHGASRDPDNYFRSGLAAAFLADRLKSALVIAPRMASNDGQSCRDSLALNEISWDCNSWRSGGASRTDSAVTSFDFVDEILRQLARKDRFPNLKTIVVTGHSAGGQVTNRYAMSSKVHDALGVPVSYVVSNPSSYAYPGNERPTAAAWPLEANAPGFILAIAPGTPEFRPGGEGRGCNVYDQWPYGFQNRKGYTASLSDDQLKRQLAARHTTYLLGQDDILPLSGFDSSCGAMVQGPTRQARGQAYARYVNEKLGAHHQVIVVTGCGHNGRCMYTSEPGIRVLFP